MKTLYAACLARLGLSQSQAAALHYARLDTVKNWAIGRRTVPEGAWSDLRVYEARIIDRSEAIREAWEDSGELRHIDANVTDDPESLMALADFFLSTETDPPLTMTVAKKP